MITISKIQVVVFVNSLVSNISFGLNQKAQMVITYLKHGYRDFVLYFLAMMFLYSQPTSADIR
jgi:hypothetical protein